MSDQMSNPEEDTPRAVKPGPKVHDAPLTAKEELAEFFKTALIAVILALVIRTFLYEPFNIPSGSMRPTLEVGDYLFVHKPAYGYSKFSFPFGIAPIEGRINGQEPKRGDVIVFKLPTNTNIDYIKRVIGLPGDKIEVKHGRLILNDEMVHREPVGLRRADDGSHTAMLEYIETLPDGVFYRIFEEGDDRQLDNAGPYIVPQGHYFMMGDNRDNSQDSRVLSKVGFVPFRNIVGRADFLFFSTNGHAQLLEFWKWPWSIRYDRLLQKIEPVRPPA